MAGAKAALAYGESLGVHTVYEEVQELVTKANELRHHIAGLRRFKVGAEELYHSAELDFISDLRGANKDMSQTAFDKFAKQEVHRDPNLRGIRAELANEAEKLERREADLATLRSRIDIGVARLNELGGYFAYLAAIKNAATRESAGSTWPGVD